MVNYLVVSVVGRSKMSYDLTDRDSDTFRFFTSKEPKIDCFIAGVAITLISIGSFGMRGATPISIESAVIMILITFVVATSLAYFMLRKK